jgi:RNA polymerase sigma factor (sigma-70 family)
MGPDKSASRRLPTPGLQRNESDDRCGIATSAGRLVDWSPHPEPQVRGVVEPSRGSMRHQGMEETTGKVLVAQSDLPSDASQLNLRGVGPKSIAGHSEGGGMLQPEGGVEDLYRSQRNVMVRLARLLTDSPAVAEEIVQEAFIRFARSPGRKDEPAAYLRVIVVNLCRSQQRRTLLERRTAPKAPLLSGIPEIDETWDLVRTLPFRQRAVLMLRYYEDLSEADIARVLSCRPGTVKSALHRGLAALRRQLSDAESAPRGGQNNV